MDKSIDLDILKDEFMQVLKAEKLFKEGKAEEALPILKDISKSDSLPARIACIILGRVYMGELYDVKTDYAQALKYLKKASKLGDDEAPVRLSRIYLTGGNGVAQDKAKALKYLKKGAKRNELGALLILGCVYKVGMFGVEPDVQKSAKLVNRAKEEMEKKGIEHDSAKILINALSKLKN